MGKSIFVIMTGMFLFLFQITLIVYHISR